MLQARYGRFTEAEKEPLLIWRRGENDSPEVIGKYTGIVTPIMHNYARRGQHVITTLENPTSIIISPSVNTDNTQIDIQSGDTIVRMKYLEDGKNASERQAFRTRHHYLTVSSYEFKSLSLNIIGNLQV